jgi:hypothetical protein
MGTLADTERTKMLDAMCRNIPYAAPAVWVKLHLGDPGTVGTAVPAANTTRAQATFSAASAGTITNSGTIEWTNVPNTETYSYVSLWTANASGTFLGSDDLSSTAPVTAGDTFRIPIANLAVSIT